MRIVNHSVTGLGVILLVLLPFAQAAIAQPRQRASVSHEYGFVVDGGHLYIPYLYYHWTEQAGRMTGTRETLEASRYEDGYVMHRYRFVGVRSGQRLRLTYIIGKNRTRTDRQLRFAHGTLYVEESQTGAVWWAKGRRMTRKQWALLAVAFMECYTNPYQAGTITRRCTNSK